MNATLPATADAASFRDPSGFIFRDDDGRLCRQVNACYSDHLQQLHASGLYEELVDADLLVEHTQQEAADAAATYLYPREIPFISYPYEWSFSMLKEAALVTLAIQQRALRKHMSLKDASAYNVQFEGSKPIFIDTLSFEPQTEGKPWVAYGQFCRHFLAPLALMSKRDIRLGRLLENFIDGVPLDLAVQQLPTRSMFNLGLFLHLHMHARAVRKHQSTQSDTSAHSATSAQLSAKSLQQLVEHLQNTISKLRWSPQGTEWIDYYQDNSYSDAMRQDKTLWIAEQLKQLQPKTVWDLGANTGLYSRVAREAGAYVVAIDIDPGCVERNFLDGKSRSERNVLPLCMDLSNPSPGLGWANRERRSLTDRGPADVALALALVHHLAIGNNVPFAMIAKWFAQLAQRLIIEFVPKDDPQTKRLLQTREDVFPHYSQAGFEAAFAEYFTPIDQQRVGDSGRVLYLYARR